MVEDSSAETASQQQTAPIPPQNDRPSMIRTLSIIVSVVLAATTIGFVGYYIAREGLDSLLAGPDAHTSISTLIPGDCFDGSIDSSSTGVAQVDCGKNHTSEVVLLIKVASEPGAVYPTNEDFEKIQANECTAQAQKFAPDALSARTAIANILIPTPDAWTNGDRQVLCFIETIEGNSITGSFIEGNGEVHGSMVGDLPTPKSTKGFIDT